MKWDRTCYAGRFCHDPKKSVMIVREQDLMIIVIFSIDIFGSFCYIGFRWHSRVGLWDNYRND